MSLFGKSLASGFLKKGKEEIVKVDRVNRKCPTCGNHMLQGRITLDERGNRNFGLIYCPEDVGMLADGAEVVKHQSTYYDPAFYCETCKQGIGEFSLKLEFGNMPKCLREDRKVTAKRCPYCDKPMEEGNFFIAFMDRYALDWYNEDLFEHSYTAPLRKRSFSWRRENNLPNAHVCKKCKRVFARFLLARDYRKNRPIEEE